MDTTIQITKTPTLKKTTRKFKVAGENYLLTHTANGYTVDHLTPEGGEKILVNMAKTLKEAREGLSFILSAQSYLRSIGAEVKGRRFTVATRFGALNVSLYADMIACQFEKPEEAGKALYGVNKNAGKHNRSFFRDLKLSVEDKLDQLKEHIEPLLFEGAAAESPFVPPTERESAQEEAERQTAAVPKTFTSRFYKGELKALLANASTEAARVNITNVAFWYGAAAVTDGHSAFCYAEAGKASWTGRAGPSAHLSPGKAAVYPRGQLETVLKACKARSVVDIDTATDEARVFHADRDGAETPAGVFQLTRYEGLFPPLRQILPDMNAYGERDAAALIGWNAALLSRVLQGFMSVSSSRLTTSRFSLPDSELSPVRIDFENADTARQWTAVVMPMRI